MARGSFLKGEKKRQERRLHGSVILAQG